MKFGLREVVFILLLAAIPLGTWWFVFRPRNARDAEMARTIEAKQAKLTQLNKTLGKIGDIQNEITVQEKRNNLLRAKLPNEKEIHNVLQDVSSLAEANKLVAKTFRQVDKAGEAMYANASSQQCEQPITMKLEGDFRGFYSFMLALETHPRIMRVRKMTVSVPEKGAAGAIQATIDMTIFFEKEKDKT